MAGQVAKLCGSFRGVHGCGPLWTPMEQGPPGQTKVMVVVPLAFSPTSPCEQSLCQIPSVSATLQFYEAKGAPLTMTLGNKSSLGEPAALKATWKVSLQSGHQKRLELPGFYMDGQTQVFSVFPSLLPYCESQDRHPGVRQNFWRKSPMNPRGQLWLSTRVPALADGSPAEVC